MANMEVTRRDEEVERLCRLFTGRINNNVARQLIQEHQGLQGAVRFLMLSPAEIVRKRLGQDLEHVNDLQRDSAKFRETLEGDKKDMQFACEVCNKMWWKRVPERKPVSKCYRCHKKYEPIPLKHQWGIGQFQCLLGHTFKGFGIMGRTKSKCFKCDMNTEAEVMFICPPKRGHLNRDGNGQRPRRHHHNCNGVNCYNPCGGFNMGVNEKPPVCIHPHSPSTDRPVRIHWASEVHVSTGSTIATILDQGSLETKVRSLANSLITIAEGSDEEPDNM